MNRKVILYIASSLDGYIAKPNDDLSFLDIVQKEGEDYGYGTFIHSVDTVIIGRKTYDWVLTQVPVFPHAEKECYVITGTARPAIGKTQFYTGPLKTLIQQLKNKSGQHIFIDGGAALVNGLLQEKLIDEMVISVIPVLLGNGTKLFADGRPEQALSLVSSRQFEKGLVQLHYKAVAEQAQ